MTSSPPPGLTPPAVLETLARMGPVLQDKVVLVVGASRGIGEGIVRGLAHTGAKLVLASRDIDATNAVADAVADNCERPLVLKVDVADKQSVEACVAATLDRHGRLDGAVNNAGISHPGALIHELPDSAYDGPMDVNVRGTFYAMRAQIRVMLDQGTGGSIVNVASTGSFDGVPTKALYAASKHAVAGLTRTGGLEYATLGVRINAIAPGTVFTDMVARGLGSTEEGRKMLNDLTPMKRMAGIEEMSGAVIWLLSDLATYVTGAVVPVDGGWNAG